MYPMLFGGNNHCNISPHRRPKGNIQHDNCRTSSYLLCTETVTPIFFRLILHRWNILVDVIKFKLQLHAETPLFRTY